MRKRLFGTLPSGEEVYEYFISSRDISLSVLDFGAAVRTLTVHGIDVAGGFDRLCDYLDDDSHQGGIVGRVANRVGGAEFEMDGVIYKLPKNDGENCLHGGVGFDRRMWHVTEHTEDTLALEYISADGEEGFPAELAVFVEYRLTNNALVIDYRAIPSAKTPIALTNHTYFNLDGLSGDVLSHRVAVYADRYTEVDDALIPTGVRPEVSGTPYDLRELKPIGEAIKALGGIDHNYVLSREAVGTLKYGRVRHAATVDNGRLTMEVYTDCEGVQLYTGNFLGSGPDFKGGIKQVKHGALCLEAQSEPNCINSGRGFYDGGEIYRQTTAYEFKKHGL